MEINSTYLKKFNQVKDSTKTKMNLRGNLILVEKIEMEVKTKTGIIITDQSRGTFNGVGENRLDFHLVVEVGSGYENEEGEDDPTMLECKAGDVVVLPTGACQYLSYFGQHLSGDQADRLGLARSSDCLIVFDGIEGFNKYFEEFES